MLALAPLRTVFLLTLLTACAAPSSEIEMSRPIGSTEGSVVAMDTEEGQKPLLYLAGSLSDAELARVAELAPNLRIVKPASREEAMGLAPQAHGIEVRFATPEFLAAAPQLHWVQATSAGVDRYMNLPELRDNEQIVFTNMQGMHGPTIADHVMGMLLVLTRDLRIHAQDARRGQWQRGGSEVFEPIALEGRTMLVVGLGGIGREVAKRAKGFGMTVWATKRTPTEPPPYVDRQETSDQLMAMLPEADVVVLCVPLTEETRGMIGAGAFAAMNPGSYLINIARGPVVDTDALMLALQNGTLAGAGLDVTDPEPLPSDHPLWQIPNVLITPHVAARSGLTSDDWTRLYRENLNRFAKGQPLLNVVDKQVGY
jgi:phosphoglycerate dehydrogenase-like enzyme